MRRSGGFIILWASSSIGRAIPLQGIGRVFDSRLVHQLHKGDLQQTLQTSAIKADLEKSP